MAQTRRIFGEFTEAIHAMGTESSAATLFGVLWCGHVFAGATHERIPSCDAPWFPNAGRGARAEWGTSATETSYASPAF